MDLPIVKMAKGKALKHFQEYRDAVKNGSEKSEIDREIMLSYQALSKGNPILDIREAFRATGLDDQGRPKLAFCRANASEVYFRGYSDRCWFCFDNEVGRTYWYMNRCYQTIPTNTFSDSDNLTYSSLKAIVPIIPPNLRPNFKLHNYHILWEAAWEDAPPVDPFLLRKISKYIYAVLAQWDLTEVEQMVLSRIL